MGALVFGTGAAASAQESSGFTLLGLIHIGGGGSLFGDTPLLSITLPLPLELEGCIDHEPPPYNDHDEDDEKAPDHECHHHHHHHHHHHEDDDE
jgi:hypothetical protein